MTISNSGSKKEKCTFLRQLMESWSDLVHSEQAFLVEVSLQKPELAMDQFMSYIFIFVMQFYSTQFSCREWAVSFFHIQLIYIVRFRCKISLSFCEFYILIQFQEYFFKSYFKTILMFPAIIYMVLKGVFKNYNPEKNETVLYRLLVQKKKKKTLQY